MQAVAKIVRTRRERPDVRARSAYLRALEFNRKELEAEKQALLQSQLVLETARERYVELFNAAPICFVALTHTGIIREINLPAVQLLNKENRRLLIGWPFSQLIAKKDRRKFLEHLSRYRQNTEQVHPFSVELQLAHRPQEKPVFIEIVSLPSAERQSAPPHFHKCFPGYY
jgi:hypothetical protein